MKKQRMALILVLAAFILSYSTVTVLADVTMIFNCTASGANKSVARYTSSVNFGQTFNFTGDHQAISIQLNFHKVGSVGGNTYVQIYETYYNATLGYYVPNMSGAYLDVSAPVATSSIPLNTDGLVTYLFTGNGAPLIHGNIYAWVFDAEYVTGLSSSNYFVFQQGSTDTYSWLTSFTSHVVTDEITVDNVDARSQVYGDGYTPDPTPTPTPPVGNWYWNGTDWTQATTPPGNYWDNNANSTNLNAWGINWINTTLPFFVPLVLIFVCGFIGYKYAGPWGFFAGLNLGIFIGYAIFPTQIGLWVVLSMIIVDAIMLLGKVGFNRKE